MCVPLACLLRLVELETIFDATRRRILPARCAKWDRHRFELKLVNPANKRLSASPWSTPARGRLGAASLAELGYDVVASSRPALGARTRSPRKVASTPPNFDDGDSIWLFYDTIKGGDFRARGPTSIAWRRSRSTSSITTSRRACRSRASTARPARQPQLRRTRSRARSMPADRPAALGAYSALAAPGRAGKVMYPRHEMLDLVVVDGHARGLVTRNLVDGTIRSWAADAVVLCTGGYGNVFYLSTNAKASNVTAAYRCYKRGAGFGNPCFTQIHPTCIPQRGEYQSKLTLMSESLRNDGRVWVPRKPGMGEVDPASIAEADRYYYLEERYPSFGNLVPRDVASRAAKKVCDDGLGVGPEVLGQRNAVYLDFGDSIRRLGQDAIAQRYGNLFEMYERITAVSPYKAPMQIYPAVHYTMGGLWVDYNLMSTIPGLHVLGEANFSDHGANRLGASALMQGLADGYFVIPYTLGHFLASSHRGKIDTSHPEFARVEGECRDRTKRLLSLRGKRPVDDLHRELGHIMWDHCGMARNPEGLRKALGLIPELRERFWREAAVPGAGEELNPWLEHAGRVADFLEFGELMCRDALERDESCGGHFREDHQTKEGEAVRDDERFCHAAVWEYQGDDRPAVRHVEPLAFENVKLSTRSYK
ncbi:MAG: succinate dehydrogenase (quinone) flavoprotein subunit [Nannocystaceae bacterium]